MEHKLFQTTKWKHIFLLLLLFLGMMALMRYTALQVKSISRGTEIPDLNFGNSADHIYQTMESFGKYGRQYYLTRFFVVDYIYAIFYASFYSYTIAFLLRKIGIKKKRLFYICLLPILGMFFDWLENLLLGLVIMKWPDKGTALCVLSNICTMTKFLLVYCSLILVIVFLIYYLHQMIKIKIKSF